MTKEAASWFHSRPFCGRWTPLFNENDSCTTTYLHLVVCWTINFTLSFLLCLPPPCVFSAAGWVMSTPSSRDSSLSWRRETTLATRPGAETAATEPSTCFPSDPSSALWVHTSLPSIHPYFFIWPSHLFDLTLPFPLFLRRTTVTARWPCTSARTSRAVSSRCAMTTPPYRPWAGAARRCPPSKSTQERKSYSLVPPVFLPFFNIQSFHHSCHVEIIHRVEQLTYKILQTVHVSQIILR